jgi:AMP-polyphosphate phosphotransferase
MLVADGVLVVKLWLHLSKERQKVRLKELESKKSTRWKVTPAEWRWFKRYDELRAASERALRQTSTLEAPWTVVEGADPRYRAFTVAQTVLQALRGRLDRQEEVKPTPRVDPSPVVARPDRLDVLKALDLSQSLDDSDYSRELAAQQRRLALLSRERGFKKHSVILVFEGPDASGKGGSIRRITAALDARQYDTFPTSAPSEEERSQPYLWRFWRRIPRKARFAIFDRSWYGRVLVERVEGFAAPHDWARAYAEINEFEEQLVRDGALLVKFWLQVSKQEQLERFKDRAANAFKRYKLSEEDWRNRAKWDEYQEAACDMIDRTSTDLAPWTLVEADDKNFARIKVLRTICDRIESAIC